MSSITLPIRMLWLRSLVALFLLIGVAACDSGGQDDDDDGPPGAAGLVAGTYLGQVTAPLDGVPTPFVIRVEMPATVTAGDFGFSAEVRRETDAPGFLNTKGLGTLTGTDIILFMDGRAAAAPENSDTRKGGDDYFFTLRGNGEISPNGRIRLFQADVSTFVPGTPISTIQSDVTFQLTE